MKVYVITKIIYDYDDSDFETIGVVDEEGLKNFKKECIEKEKECLKKEIEQDKEAFERRKADYDTQIKVLDTKRMSLIKSSEAMLQELKTNKDLSKDEIKEMDKERKHLLKQANKCLHEIQGYEYRLKLLNNSFVIKETKCYTDEEYINSYLDRKNLCIEPMEINQLKYYDD